MFNELKTVWKQISRQFGFTSLVVCLLGLGIGLGSAMLSTVNAVLTPPFRNAEQLSWIRDRSTSGDLLLTPAEFEILRTSGANVLEGSAAYTQFEGEDYLTSGADLYPVNTSGITDDMFQVLGLAPARGRTFSPDDNGPVTIISWNIWQQVFQGRKDIIGQVIKLNGFGFTVVGVMGPNLGFPNNRDLWLPLRFLGDLTQPYLRDSRRLHVFARFRNGIDPSQRQAFLQAATTRARSGNDKVYEQAKLTAAPFMEEFLSPLAVMLATGQTIGISVFVLVVTNVSVLILLQRQRRLQNTAIRVAFGASATSILRESALRASFYALLGSTLACLVAIVTLSLTWHWVYSLLPEYVHVSVRPILLWACIFGIICAVVLSTAPQLLIFRTDLGRMLAPGQRTTGGRQLRRVLSLLLTFEIAATTALMFVGMLSVRRFRALQNMPLGIQPADLYETQIYIPGLGFKSHSEKMALIDNVTAGLFQIPGIAAVSSGLTPIAQGFARQIPVRSTDAAGTDVAVDPKPVSRGYFAAAGIPLISGRDFSQSELEHSGAVIVDQTTARLLWGEQPAIGRTVRIQGHTLALVIGVAGSTNYFGGIVPKIYQPLMDGISDGQSFVILHVLLRSKMSEVSLHRAVENSLRNVGGSALTSVRPVAGELGTALITPRSQASLAWLMSVISLVVAAAGIYGVTSYWTSLRTLETAIRVALGATPDKILIPHFRWLFGTALLSVAAGLGISAFVLSRSADASRIPVYDPVSLSVVFGAITLLILAGTVIPTWKTASREPQCYLRMT